MSESQSFIFQPGIWLGEGTVNLTISDEELKFFTKWQVPPMKTPIGIACIQEIQIQGLMDKMEHQILFSSITDGSFNIDLENQNLGKVKGQGIIKPTMIAWEYKQNENGFEGFEFYERLADGSYFMHAEYVTKEDLRTRIQGKIWKKATT